MKMKTFPFFSKLISIPMDEPHTIIFMSENSSFIKSYSKLNIRRQFAKKISAVSFKVPRIVANMKILLPYKESLKLLPILKPDGTNAFIDCGIFFHLLEEKYGQGSYRRPIVFQKVVAYLNECKSFNPVSKNILMYHVNMNSDIHKQFFDRRCAVLALMSKIGGGALPFDVVVLALENAGLVKYYILYNKEQKPLGFQKIFSIFKKIGKKEDLVNDDPSEDELTEVAESVMINDEKRSILKFIEKQQKHKLVTS